MITRPRDAAELRTGQRPRDEEFLELCTQRYLHLLHGRLIEAEVEVAAPPPEGTLLRIEKQLSRLRRTAHGGSPLAIDLLSQRCGLSAADQEILLLGAAVETSSALRRLLGLWPGLPGYRPTLRFAQDFWGPTAGTAQIRERFGAFAPLRRLALLTLSDHPEWDDTSSAAESEYQVSDRVIRFLLGETGLAPYLQTYARLSAPTVGFDDLRMPRTVPDALRSMLRVPEGGRGRWWNSYLAEGPILLMAVGYIGSCRYALAEAMARELGLAIIEVDYQALSTETEDFGHYLTRLFREATLQHAVVAFVNCTKLIPNDDFDATGFWVLSRKLETFNGPVALCLDKPLHFHQFPQNRRIFRADLEVPPALYRRELWSQLLPAEGVDGKIDVWALAKIFNFGGGGIREMICEATNLVLMRDGPDAKVRMDDLMAAGRELQSRRMGKLTKRMIPKQTLDDLVTTPRVRKAIEDIIATVRYRHIVFQDWGFSEKIHSGKGMSALFSGPPGTGKSMAAGVIARECGMNLFRVNLAMVVSKWVGETEERLSKLFEQAKESHSVLLFDEADALFSKRSKVKSAQDKYANLEVNHLLQEVENFEGMVVLTTNLEAQIDKAFLRRLNFRVFFPKPEPEDRMKIWKAHIPSKAPFDPKVDWRALAEDFDFTGGYIKNSIVRAAQWAAERDGLITQDLLCKAAEAEMAETGRVIREVYQDL